jgi:hypothetical protein
MICPAITLREVHSSKGTIIFVDKKAMHEYYPVYRSTEGVWPVGSSSYSIYVKNKEQCAGDALMQRHLTPF